MERVVREPPERICRPDILLFWWCSDFIKFDALEPGDVKLVFALWMSPSHIAVDSRAINRIKNQVDIQTINFLQELDQ